MPKTLLMLALSCLVALSAACSKKASSPSGGGGKGDDDDAGDTDGGGSGGDDGCSSSSDDDEKKDDEEAAELRLLAGTTYDDIKDIFEDNCTSCHGADKEEGGIKLNSYDDVKDNAEAALAAIEDGSMPKDGELDDADKEAVAAFVEDGMKEEAGEGSDDGSSGSSSNCGGGGEDDGEADANAIDVDNFEAVLNPPELKACHDQDKIFWRNSTAEHALGYCIDVDYPAAFDCNRAGALEAFGNADEAKAFFDEKEAAGWTYDQCGVKGGKPAVVMRCIEIGTACGALADADPKALVIKSSAISTLSVKLEDMPPL